MAKQGKHRSSESIQIERSKLKPHPNNPRKITQAARKKLKASIKKNGVVGGIVWNAKSGFIVGGHQRIDVLDEINSYDGTPETDYLVNVEKVELESKEELELIVLLNNRSVQGEFDNDLLAEIIPMIDYQAAGLDDYDLNFLGVMLDEPEPAALDIMADLEEVQKPAEEKKAHVKEMRKQFAEKKVNEVQEGESYFMMTFDSYQAKAAFMQRFGFDPLDKYVKGEIFENMVEFVGE